MTMEHSDLIQEMPHIEQMPTQERLILAKRRRTYQLKVWSQRDKEYSKRQAKHAKSNKRNIRFDDSVTLLEAAARNDIDEVRRLLMRDVNPDSCNEDGLTALHQCCIDDNGEMLALLLEYGANVNAEDSEKWTPLHAAATCGHLKLVRILITHGANLLAVNADGNMPYDICEDDKCLDYIENEMAKRGVTQQLIDNTRAHTEMRMLEDLKLLAAQNGDLEAYDSQGATPLHIAAANGYTSVVDFLLQQNVRTDVKDKDDWQPAHAAACWGHLDVLELLVHAGADLNAKNKHDETPADICEDAELKERILQLRNEQETKRQAEAQKRRVRRSHSNTRTQSVRRTSLRDKGLTARRDAVEEVKLRLQAENKTIEHNAEIKQNNNPASTTTASTMNQSHNDATSQAIMNNHTNAMALVDDDNDRLEDRKAPEGKDNDSFTETELAECKNGQTITTDVNGKVTVVHVVVTINGNGTLADLKKQRSQIRNSNNDVSSFTSPVSTISDGELVVTQPTNTDLIRFTGATEDTVEYSKPKRCCVIQ